MNYRQKKRGIGTFFLLYLAAPVFLGAVLPAGSRVASGAPGKPANEYQIAIRDFSFQPTALTVPAGAKVVWTNRDEEPHTVVSTGDAFKSKALDTDERFSFAFEKPGTYQYFCSVHPRMTGKVIVK